MIAQSLALYSSNSSVVRISGGLGNQLSQLAFSIALANKIQAKTYLDMDSYSYGPRNSERLPLLHLLYPSSNGFVCSTPLIKRALIPIASDRIRRLFSQVQEQSLNSAKRYFFKDILRENGFPYDATLQFQNCAYYIGNFISCGYWKEYNSEILKEFNSILLEFSTSTISGSTFSGSKTLAIHARRGDYLSNPKARKFHGYCGDQYFLKAVHTAVEVQKDFDQIYISSDDIEYSRHLGKSLLEFKIPVQIDLETNPIKTLIALSSSTALIGSNSTYSWWAGNLGKDKDLYFPTKWFADPRYSFKPEEQYLKRPILINVPLET